MPLALSNMSLHRSYREVPLDYTTPSFPSLYWPINAKAGSAYYLYNNGDIWRFTLFWTLITYGAVHLAASLYAVAVQGNNWKVIWVVPVVYLLVGGIEALFAGSVVGLMYVHLWFGRENNCARRCLCLTQFGICLRGGLLQDVDLDAYDLVLGQHSYSYSGLFLYTRWPLDYGGDSGMSFFASIACEVGAVLGRHLS